MIYHSTTARMCRSALLKPLLRYRRACKETSLGTPRRGDSRCCSLLHSVPSLTVQLHEDRADRLGEKRELSSASLKGQQKAAQY
jgi:hypothetical protein